ncbi:MAG: autotransporter domain-containing protein [Nitrococcus mobilis]|nr:autotransporter domain-containing protein [Nitrococcus mobilis]
MAPALRSRSEWDCRACRTLRLTPLPHPHFLRLIATIGLMALLLPGVLPAATLRIIPPSNTRLAEGSGTTELTAELTLTENTSNCRFTADIATSGTATQGPDYTISMTNISIDVPGSQGTTTATQALGITVNDDTEIEPTEEVTLQLTNLNTGSASTINGNSSSLCPTTFDAGDAVTLSIDDDDDTAEPAASDISLQGQPGQTVESTFTVTDDSPPITVSTDIGEVTPTSINASSGEVTFRFTVPAGAQTGDTFTGEITLEDAQGNASTVSVTIGTELDLTSLPGLDHNQASVANALQGACEAIAATPEDGRSAGQEDLLASCTSVQNSDNPGAALDQLAPEEVAIQGRTALALLRQHQTSIYRRLTMLPRDGGGVDISGINLTVAGQNLPGSVLQQAAERLLGAGAGDILDLGRLSAFVTGNFSILERDGTGNEQGFESNAWDITVGADYRFWDNLVLGGALGYADSAADVNGNAGESDVTALTTTLYGKYYFPERYYVSGALTYSHNQYDSTRDVTLGAARQLARGDTNGNQFGANLNGGYDLTYQALTVALQGRITYLNTGIDGYKEKASDSGAPGSGTLLRIGNQTIDSLVTELATQLTYAISTGIGVISPTFRVGWAHEFLNDQRFIDARFLNDPTGQRFSVRTDEPDRNYFNLGFGASAVFPHGLSVFLFTEWFEGRSDTRYYAFTAGARLEF